MKISSSHDRKTALETRLENAQHMLELESDIAESNTWSDERKTAAKKSIPVWRRRVADLKLILKGYQ